jgi:thioredoxin reductase (NADPH)
MKIYSTAILGSGPAGLTAAIYASRANLNPLCLEGPQPGGQLTITSDVENYPGFAEPILGPELMDRFRGQAQRFGTEFVSETVAQVKLASPFELILDNGSHFLTKTIIIATGASAKWLGIPSEKKMLGKGVSACATCDGFFFKGMDIAVVGGGDTALEEASFLTRFAKSVTVVHRRNEFRASKAMQQKVFNNPKIRVIWNKTVEEIQGDQSVTGILVKDRVTGHLESISVAGVFIAIGHDPNTKPFRSLLSCDEKGYILVDKGTTYTSVPGIFAAGDVSDPLYRQAVSAAGSGCMAALDVERYLEEHQ